jgi:hypothetical protein
MTEKVAIVRGFTSPEAPAGEQDPERDTEREIHHE